MDTTKLWELIGQSPQWLKLSFAMWLLSGAMLLTILFVFRPTRDDSNARTPVPPANDSVARTSSLPNPTILAQAPVNSSAPVVDPVAAVTAPLPEQLSVKKYFNRIAALDGRFLQQQEFLTSMKGKTVSWEGAVKGVFEGSSRVVVELDPNLPNVKNIIPIFFPTEFRAQLFSLRSKDHVRIEGVYADEGFYINGTNLTVLLK